MNDIIKVSVRKRGEYMETKCPICGAPLADGKCGYCGYATREPVQESENIYSDLGQAEIEQRQQENVVVSPILNSMGIVPGISRKSKTTALLLCIFLGGLGVHRFYVGKGGTGILYLFTVGFLGIGWIIDIIRIATGSFRDEFDLPLKQ